MRITRAAADDARGLKQNGTAAPLVLASATTATSESARLRGAPKLSPLAETLRSRKLLGRCSVLERGRPTSSVKMVLESTVVCVDNSEYMRNGDFIPTRLQAQQEAVSLVCHSKTRSNPENNVGLLTLASSEVLATLTTDVGRLLSKLHQVQPKGDINFLTAIRIAHLVLKHRQGKNHKMRIVVFVGSPIETDSKELTKLAKRLKKEKVNVDIVNFGEDNINTEKLATFINTLNGKDGSGSHLVTVPPGHQTHLSDALISSPVIQGEDGTGGIGLGVGGFEFGVDPNEDPELALALRVSMEEQRQRQEDDARRAAANSAKEGTQAPSTAEAESGSSEERLLERALAMSMETDPADTA